MRQEKNSIQKSLSCPGPRQFTLIEILVVVAIIGILASLLLPSLSKARKSARTSLCINNAKNIASAIFMYPDDNDNYFPPGDGANRNITYDDFLGMGTYDGRNNITYAIANLNKINDEIYGSKIYYCPEADSAYITSNNEPIRTYTVNDTLMDTRGDSVTVNEVGNASKTIMLFDNNGNWAQGWKAAAAGHYADDARRHSQHSKTYFSVMAFADGSVRNIYYPSTTLAAAGSEEMWDLD